MNLAESLNLECLCSTFQPQLMSRQVQERPNLYSATPVFITAADFETISRSVDALHRVAALPGYIAAALGRSNAIAALDFGPQGAFMGYDFHVSADGPRLIEINTNAGGALLHAEAARAHRLCCESMDRAFNAPSHLDQLDATFIEMFLAEWRSQRSGVPLRSIAIVDDEPTAQFLAPEFEMVRALFESHGIHAVVADPQELQWRGGRLWHASLPNEIPVDMIYNRLTDFDLSQPRHASLRAAYVDDAVVITPNPRAHALHADKRNLVALSDDAQLASWGATAEDREVLRAVVPRTSLVTADTADALWAERRHLFFKPATGYGSKAAYRGDKLTRRVWGEIGEGDFVAQTLVPPSERSVKVDGERVSLKVDIRAYAYAGKVQLLAARTYSGQTTNFRTPGGGFSPVIVLPLQS
jgi:hypothetical protein